MSKYIATDGVKTTGKFTDKDDAYDAFINEFKVEPQHIIDITNGHNEAQVVWENTEINNPQNKETSDE